MARAEKVFRRPTLTTAKYSLVGLRKPLSLGMRRDKGVCPPSKPTRSLLRAFSPLVPRPAVLPRRPDSPRPTLILRCLEPGAGRR